MYLGYYTQASFLYLIYLVLYLYTSIVVYDLPLIDTTNKITISHMIIRDQEVNNKHILIIQE